MRRTHRALAGTLTALPLLVAAAVASAGELDETGAYVPDPAAVAVIDFGPDFDPATDYFTPDDLPPNCQLAIGYALVDAEDALLAGRVARIQTNIFEGCSERFNVALPSGRATYRARMWMRHGSIDAQLTAVYPDATGRGTERAKLAPTGRVTSDGWVELESNDFSIDADLAEAVYFRFFDVDNRGTEIDGLEVVPVEAPYREEGQACGGVADDVCGPGALCVYNRCRIGERLVPPLPDASIRDAMVEAMKSQLEVFFGGRKNRLQNLPAALTQLDAIRVAEDPWAFWNGWGTAIRLLQDWHTRANSAFGSFSRERRLNLCFLEGEADMTASAWPPNPNFRDILVSHTGTDGTHGIAPGDRLVAVDGLHPVEWALSLVDVDWGYWRANENRTYAELVERMRGLILRYATTFSVVHCDANAMTCAASPQQYRVDALPLDGGNQVRCDNRPFYHLPDNPGPNHGVGFNFYRGLVTESNPTEAIYGLMWDTLFGGGDPNGYVNGNLKDAWDDFRQNARGVILDHRAGNGGTLDGAETATELIRPPTSVLVFASPARRGAWDGPETVAEGIDLFDALQVNAMVAGSNQWDPDLPVALLLHRDGSASDFMPFAFKGAPKTRVFGPGPTAGAFSTFYELSYWGGISFQLASGDSISFEGQPLIGRGVDPDEVVLQTQSDLLQGLDTMHEAALAWVRSELKP